VATQASVGISPSPATITLQSGIIFGSTLVTVTNTSTTTSTVITNAVVAGRAPPPLGMAGWLFMPEMGADHCTGVNLAPGAACTYGVTFVNMLSPRGVNRSGTVTFTDDATPTLQVDNLTGFATP
jgi:hypothetical protein